MQIILSWTNYYTKLYRINSAKKELDILTFQEVRKILRKENIELTKEMFKNSTPSEILINNSQYFVFEEVKKPSITDIIIIKIPVTIISSIIHFPQTIENIKQAFRDYKEIIDRERMLDREREGLDEENEDEEDENDDENENDNVEASETKPKRRKPKRRVLTEEQKQKILEQKRLNKQRMEEEQERRKKAREAASATMTTDPFSGNANAFLPSPLPKKKKEGEENDSEEEEEEEVPVENELKTGPWDSEEYAQLVRLSKKYPAGTPGRWVRIGMEMHREVDDVAYNANLLKKDPKLALVS